jgi:hypothetical protein
VITISYESPYLAGPAGSEDYPALGSRPIGGSLKLFTEVEGIEEVLAAVQKSGAKDHDGVERTLLRDARVAFEGRKAGSSPLQKESSNEYKPKGTEDHGAVCPVSSVPFLAEV